MKTRPKRSGGKKRGTLPDVLDKEITQGSNQGRQEDTDIGIR